MDDIKKSDTNDLRTKLANEKGEDFYDQKLSNGLTYRELLEKDILDLMGFTELSEDKRKELHEKIGNMLETRIIIQILDQLSEKEVEEYDALLKEGKNEEATDYLIKKGVDPSAITVTETIVLKIELIEDGYMLKNKLTQAINNQTKEDK